MYFDVIILSSFHSFFFFVSIELRGIIGVHPVKSKSPLYFPSNYPVVMIDASQVDFDVIDSLKTVKKLH